MSVERVKEYSETPPEVSNYFCTYTRNKYNMNGGVSRMVWGDISPNLDSVGGNNCSVSGEGEGVYL